MTQNTPHFPLFVDLTGKRCVVVGGGPVAARRADVLAASGRRSQWFLLSGAAVPEISSGSGAHTPPAISTAHISL